MKLRGRSTYYGSQQENAFLGALLMPRRHTRQLKFTCDWALFQCAIPVISTKLMRDCTIYISLSTNSSVRLAIELKPRILNAGSICDRPKTPRNDWV